jgi:type I restriction enzyme M protein
LFIDARNIFRQIDRAHREFTEEQIQNIATIVRLHRGETKRLTALLKKYKAQAADFEKQAAAQHKICEQLKKEKPKLDKELKRWEKQMEDAEKQYKALHDKQLYYEGNIAWLTERFPKGVYEDVTGLCKAATLAEIEEQEWSLNPGRYVGVVIEEDGLTEEEFLAEMKERQENLNSLKATADTLEIAISKNLKALYQDV